LSTSNLGKPQIAQQKTQPCPSLEENLAIQSLMLSLSKSPYNQCHRNHHNFHQYST